MPLSGLALGAPAIVGLGERIAAAVRGVQQQLLNMRRSRLPDFFRRLPSARLLVTEFGASVLADAFRRNNGLTEVDLRGNDLVSAGASLLADALKVEVEVGLGECAIGWMVLFH